MTVKSMPFEPSTALAETHAPAAWSSLYRIAAVGAWIISVFIIFQVVIYIVWPPPQTVEGWIRLYATSPLLALLDMDLLLIIDSILMIPLFLALYLALRRANQSLATLGALLGFVSVCAFFASNPAFDLLSVSQQYAAAVSEAQRSTLLAAAQGMIIQWTGTAYIVYYVLGSIAPILLCAAMLQTRLFSRVTASLGIAFNLVALGLFVPGIGVYLSLLSVLGLLVWFFLVGRGLWALAGWES